MAKLKLTEETVKPYLVNIINWELDVPAWFWDLTPKEIAECFNGVGSELTAKPIRKALSHIYNFAIEGVIAHDVIWSFVKQKNLTLDDFKKSNRDLKNNARKCLKQKYSWYNPYYSWCYAKAWLAEWACNKYGKEAWNK